MDDLWKGLRAETRDLLTQRNYQLKTLAERLGTTGVEASELFSADRKTLPWIPGVEVLPRRIFPQRHRGFFGEFARQGQGRLGEIGMWPRQWATATMWPGTSKGFHIHPPFIPEGTPAEVWFKRLFVEEPDNFALRPYDQEQWDAMYFVQGVVEMFLVDERAGMEKRVMRLMIEGDNHRGANNACIVIPAGVAHALRVESSESAIMVYGTSTTFNPDFEGRIASRIEMPEVPPDWAEYISA